MTYCISWVWFLDGVFTEQLNHKIISLISGLSLTFTSFLISSVGKGYLGLDVQRKEVLDDMKKLGEMTGMAKATNHFIRGGSVDGLKAKINAMAKSLNIEIEHEETT